MNKPLLQETLWKDSSKMIVNPLVEETINGEKRKFYYLDGVFLQGEIKNLNGRIYPQDEIETAVKTLQEQIKLNGSVPGELDHPETLVISTHNISHVITDIHMQGSDAVGRMKIIPDVPSGAIAEGLLKAGVPIGVSSRGAGNVDDYTGVVSDFEIITIDIVATPSAPGARPTPIYEQLMKSSKNEQLVKNYESFLADEKRRFKPQLDQDLKAFIDELRQSWKKFN